MISVDTNIVFAASDQTVPEHRTAREFLDQNRGNLDFIICELVLVELYILLRNPTVLERPLSAAGAVAVCQSYRTNPRWCLVENAPIMDDVWKTTQQKSFARRRIIDARLALTLRYHGVREFATANTKDFQGFGFDRVWNPLKAL